MSLSALAKDPQYQAYLGSLENKYGLPTGLLYAQQKHESNFNPNAIGPETKYGTAKGIAQFIDSTAKEYGINPLDPYEASDGQARMLSRMAQKYNGDIPSVLAAYNWGAGNVDSKGLSRAPKETRNYISNIMGDLSGMQAPQVASSKNVSALGQIASTVGNAIIPQAQASELPEGWELEAPPQQAQLPDQQPAQQIDTTALQKVSQPQLPEGWEIEQPKQASGVPDLYHMAPEQRQEYVNSLARTPQQYSDAHNMTLRPLKGAVAGLVGMIPDSIAALSNLSPSSLMTGTSYNPNVTGGALEALDKLIPTDQPETFGGFLGQEAAGAVGAMAAPLPAAKAAKSAEVMIPKAMEMAKTALAPKAAVPTAAEMRAASSADYKAAEALGANYNEKLMIDVMKQAREAVPKSAVERATIGQTEAESLIKRLEPFEGKPVNLDDVRGLDRGLGELINKVGVDSRTGSLNSEGNRLMEIQNTIRENAFHNPDEYLMGGKEGIDALKSGIQKWSKQAQMGDIERIIERASSMDQPARAMQTGLRTLAANKKRFNAFTPEVKELILKYAKPTGTDELMRLGGSRLVQIIAAGGGHIGGAAAASAIGLLSRGGAEAVMVGRMNHILEKIATGTRPKRSIKSKGAK